jgi:integral membrane protein
MKFNLINLFRQTAFIEGISYLSLLFIAMPLKYIYDYPIAVKVVGMAHGILFILFIFLLLSTVQKYRFSTLFTVVLLVASLLPFGTFFPDIKLKEYSLKKQLL